MSYKYRFTIFTPCYNSEKYIHRVYESLEAQTFRNFEWLVINDASTDGTHALIEEYKLKSSFPINYINLEKNQMITANFNMAFIQSNGQFFIPAGHDDAFTSKALEIFNSVWEQYGSNKFSGVSCLCVNQKGEFIGDQFPSSPYFSDYFDVVYNKKVKGEKWGFTRTDILKNSLLPLEIDRYIPESLVWMNVGCEYKTIYINEPLRIYYIHEKGNVSLSANNSKMYSKGMRYYYLQVINIYHKKIRRSYKIKIWDYIAYIKSSLNSNVRLQQIVRDTLQYKSKILVFFLMPLGVVLWLYSKRKKNRYKTI